ncbi:MAG: glycerol-3-phosphate dehydrogenase/oxidase [Rhodothermales bacterium]|nr:glycerol-3-phosphate dehydrogenase/oxidase [Rhodothermales bacterium]
MMTRIEQDLEWDVIIVGGGATGLGTAIDSAARGYTTVLLEQDDFAKGTSSRSTKLVHGGVRYLKQGNVALVLEALRERGRLKKNAPHLVSDLPFIVPVYDWWEGPFYGIGLRVYDWMSGRLGLGDSENLSREETLARLPTIESDGLRGGVVYFDAQFDDARLALNMAQTAAGLGATVANYVRVIGMTKTNSVVRGVVCRDEETGRDIELRGKVVINATGVFSDSIRRMDDPDVRPVITPSQGVHIVLDQSFLPGNSAIMVPNTDDGRVLFAIPWHGTTVIGTTDTEVPFPSLEPKALEEEIDFLLTHAARYLTHDPIRSDVRSVFAGLRPLVSSGEDDTSAISREHTILISTSGLVTITGGKWTTYRVMAKDAVDQAAIAGGLEPTKSSTKKLKIHGWTDSPTDSYPLGVYGSDADGLNELISADPGLVEVIHPDLPYVKAQVVWAVREEMARTVEDVLSRRTRAILLYARASLECARSVAEIMQVELDQSEDWVDDQVATYSKIAAGYILS